MTRIGYMLLKCWVWCVAISPYWLLYLRSDFYFFLVYHVAHYRRKVVRQNLLRSFPEKGLKEIKGIEKRFYRNLCDLVVETAKLSRMTRDEVIHRIVVTNPGVMTDLQDRNKSLFLAIPHSGNWEWFGKRMQTLSAHYPMAIYKKVQNAIFEQFMLELRTNFNGDMVESNTALRTLAHRTNQLVEVLVLADQSPMGQKSDYWTEFLHQETSWFIGLERMAKYLDFPVVFVAMKRTGRGRYEVTFHTITETPKETEKGFIMEQYARHIEHFIQEQPDNWLWSHRRWKRQRNQEAA